MRYEPVLARHRWLDRGRDPVDRGEGLARTGAEHALDMVMTNPPFGKKSSITMIGDDGKAVAADITISRADF